MDTILAQEELAFIRKVMADSRTKVVDDGKPTILWGIIVFTAMAFTYIEAITQVELYVGWIWLGLSVVGWLYIILYRQKLGPDRPARTFAGKMIGMLWGATGVAISLMVFMVMITRVIGTEEIVSPLALCPLVSLMIGVAYFISGVLYGLNWVRNIAWAWWTGAVGMFLWPSVHILGMYCIMIVFFQIIPGIILYRNSKKELQAA
jgi:hypothetical protein